MRFFLTLAALGVSAGLAVAQPAAPAPAPPPTAEALHQQGRELARAWRQSQDRRQLEQAARLFKDALALGDSPLIECDLGLALHYLGEDARAHARLTRCMPRLAAVSPDKVSGYRGIEDEVAAAVAKDHAAVDIATSPPGAVVTVSTFPTDETVLAPTLLWLRAGSHRLTAHVDGHVDSTFTVEVSEAEAAAGARKSWRVKLEPTAVIDNGGGGGGGDGGVEVPPGLVNRPAASRTPAYAALAVGGAMLVGGGVTHFLGRDRRAHLATLSGDAYDAYLPTWQKYQRATIGLYAAGAIATGVGTWLYLRAGTPAPMAVSPTPEGDGAMIWVFSR